MMRDEALGAYTLEEVAAHCKPDDVWMVADGNVGARGGGPGVGAGGWVGGMSPCRRARAGVRPDAVRGPVGLRGPLAYACSNAFFPTAIALSRMRYPE